MKISKRNSIFVLLLIFAAIRAGIGQEVEDEYEDADEPATPSAMLLVRRKLSIDTPQIGKIMTVTVEVYNAGEAAATEVSVVEEEWASEAFMTEGNLQNRFNMIPAGAAESFSYSITPKLALHQYQHYPTTVEYVAVEGKDKITTEGPPLVFAVFSASDVMISRALRIGSVISLGLLNTQKQWMRFAAILGGSGLVFMLMSLYRAAATARQHRNRQKILKEFGIDDDKTK